MRILFNIKLLEQGLFYTVLGIIFVGCSQNIVTRPPKVLTKEPIEYPLEAIEQNVEGDLELAIFILTDGTIGKVEVTHSTGSPVLDSAGVRYARNLQYTPALENGKKKSVWLRQRIGFNLQTVYFHPRQWKENVYTILSKLSRNPENERNTLLNSLYTEYIHYASYVTNNPEENINGLVQTLVHQTVRDRWKNCWDLIPLSSVMFDDYLTRFPDTHLSQKAQQHFLTYLDYDIQLIEQRLIDVRERRIAQLQKMRQFLTAYKTEISRR